MTLPEPGLVGWLDGSAEPVREGVYRRAKPGGPYSCWSQGRWYGDAATPSAAARFPAPSRHQRLAWAGLAEPPAAPCWLCRGHGCIDRGVDPDSGDDLIEPCSEC